ncbi:hypothetical protein [Aliivibrio fischeri]|uniref:hypothetical protein n=1 Tax=Aliivibrio fischeri TaxID=668 RepID=UPI00080E75EA|nr:hypothetical protein [Aliivibrio fischeri]OCH01682.1 hypothetical protein A6E10_18400 [Aliivibrio fischeri]
MQFDDIEKNVRNSWWTVVTIFGLTIASYVGWFAVINDFNLSNDPSNWGAFGDFIGGLLNPLIAFSAFYWLTISVLVQKKELAETRIALSDASKAQVEQAELARKNAEVEVVNMRFKLLLSELNAEREYLNQIVSDANHPKGHVSIMDKDGNKVTIKDHAPGCHAKIQRLEKELTDLIDKADKLTART